MLHLTAVRHAYPEKAGFTITRNAGHPHHTLLHFFGSVELLVGGKRVITKPNACILYEAGAPQYFNSQTPLVHDWLHFTGDLTKDLPGGLRPETLYYPSNPEEITALYKQIEAEFFLSRKCKKELLSAKMTELFVTLVRAEGETTPCVPASLAGNLSRIRNEMFSALREDWTVARLARLARISQSRFYALYKACFGNSPIEDLICARMDEAKRLLTYYRTPVCRIAEDLGYRNPSHFIRQFTARVGVSPAAYRKNSASPQTAA